MHVRWLRRPTNSADGSQAWASTTNEANPLERDKDAEQGVLQRDLAGAPLSAWQVEQGEDLTLVGDRVVERAPSAGPQPAKAASQPRAPLLLGGVIRDGALAEDGG